jgi:7-carboxy-7-deazaguanine synthase
VAEYPTRYVVVTGGEPLLAPEIVELTCRLKQRGAHITIETAATIFKPVAADLISMSPKLANSTPWKREGGKFAQMHEHRRLNPAVIEKFLHAHDYQLKFVVERRKDFAEIGEILAQLKGVDAAQVMIMAQGTTVSELKRREKWIVESCKFFGYRFTPRLHIQLFGNRRGT